MVMTSRHRQLQTSSLHASLLLVFLAAGCGGGSEIDPTIKVEQGKNIDESALKRRGVAPKKKQEAAPKQRLSRGIE